MILLAAILACSPAWAGLDEFRIKREAVYAFVRTPQVTQEGDRVQIRFETKGYCDVTIAIEEAVPEGVRNPRRVPDTLSGRIVRHLASGVLGPNAPEPFAKNSKSQTIAWDGKDDQGTYIDDKSHLTVRVSLGLRARFERSLYWSPHKRISSMPIIRAAPEGVYVCEGSGVDHLRLFDHTGNYVRTIYPFPADTLGKVMGLRWHDFPQGYRRPLKESLYQQTLLTSGDNDNINDKLGMGGRAATAMAVHGNRIALAFEHLNRLAADGTTGGVPLKGPKTGIRVRKGGYGGYDRGMVTIGPSSMAFSPDGTVLYMTGWLWKQSYGGARPGCLHAVLRMEYDKGAEPTVFVGSRDRSKWGTGNSQLTMPTSVACDAEGRVYVTDYLNDRVQVFAPDGTHLRTMASTKPAKVLVHQRTGEIYVFSWAAFGIPDDVFGRRKAIDLRGLPQTLTRFSPVPEAKRISHEAFPLGFGDSGMIFAQGQVYQVELDSWTDPPTIWVVGRKHRASRADLRANASAAFKREYADPTRAGVRALQKHDGEWRVVRHFGEEAKQAVVRVQPARNAIQQLYFNPGNERLYVGEPDSGATWKAYKQLLEIDPETGRIQLVDLPFNALDVAFDQQGLIYLRTTDVVVRYDPETWREVPWDYGTDLEKVGSGMYGRYAPATSGLLLPARSPVCFHQGGMSVSPRGRLAVACHNRASRKHHSDFGEQVPQYSKPYAATLYPGREESSTSYSVHVWDERGRVIHKDAIPGLPQIDGVFIDANDDLYVMATPTRVLDGTKYFNDMSETLMKFTPGTGRFVSTGGAPIPLPEEDRPPRPPDVYRMGVKWVEGAQWYYGGVGFGGFNSSRAGGGCACWHARFVLDYFGRSIAPQPYQFNVAVVDSAGNLIMHIGRYGNVDDGVPLKRAVPKGARNLSSKVPDTLTNSPLGGDEVGLFHANFVGTHTDRRVFISDVGNGRIVSVKLDYHATERVPLNNASDTGK